MSVDKKNTNKPGSNLSQTPQLNDTHKALPQPPLPPPHPSSPQAPGLNKLGLQKSDYKGLVSTMCTGCGHDSITSHIISAFHQSNIDPRKVAKLSGIGCSSKTPAYFLSQAHGLNTLHGRMAPASTGAKVANRDLIILGVSGDGDTSNIGLGGFAHLIRRNLPMVYITENNGVYGLTKGQFSATADENSTLKSGTSSPLPSIDLCSMAIDLGCGFVARSFSGDSKQLVPLISAALRHNGTAFIDVLSPCMAFANHSGSTKSYSYVKEHQVHLQEIGFIQPNDEIEVDYDEGQTELITLPDGSRLQLKKLDKSHDYQDPIKAMEALQRSRSQLEILTGLIYLNTKKSDYISLLNLTSKPLARLSEDEIKAPTSFLEKINKEFS